MQGFINWGDESPEQLENRRKYEEEIREFMLNKMVMEAKLAAKGVSSAAVGGRVEETTTTTTAATTTTTHVPGLDFTIEWFMKTNTWNSHPRPYSLGDFNTGAINAVSIESSGTHLYWWQNGSIGIDGTFSADTNWHHYAVCRNNGTVRVFRDGQQVGTSFTLNSTMTATGKLLNIGTDQSDSGAYVNGLITNFRWTTKALYTSTFTPSTSPLTALAETKVLLLATDSGSALTDSSAYARSVTNHNSATWNAGSPFAGGVGGSIQFNGTNQFLTLAASTDWNL